MKWFPAYNFILASKSPRRQLLLKSLGLDFKILVKEVEEIYPRNLNKEEIPLYLAQIKSKPFKESLRENDLLITADTIVWHNNEVLGKPKTKMEAKNMIRSLSGNEHEVVTGVCLTSLNKQIFFSSLTTVQFKGLTEEEIDYYITEFEPFDKAGGYGIQEWIGSIGITNIKGSFYNVMGLPIQKLYEEIQKF